MSVSDICSNILICPNKFILTRNTLTTTIDGSQDFLSGSDGNIVSLMIYNKIITGTPKGAETNSNSFILTTEKQFISVKPTSSWAPIKLP